MPHIDKHSPGSFCWIELGTTDQNGAKQFYTALFGWDVADTPMGPNEYYSMFKLEGRDAAAAYTLRPEMLEQGVPPHWMVYVAVESADTAAGEAERLGGKIMAPPFDVFDFGRMAVIQDPAGAAISIWQAKKHTGTGITGIPGTLCWADLSTSDPKRAGKFHTGLFGWKLTPSEDGGGYEHIVNGEEPIGGIPPAEQRDPKTPPHWLPYFLVADIDATAAKAESLGAKFYLSPMTIEKVGRIAVLADPQGAVFALYQELPRG
jgi:predicted enzyme related to lactoylglutathione lyase